MEPCSEDKTEIKGGFAEWTAVKQGFIQNAMKYFCNIAMYSIPNHKNLFLASTLDIHYVFFPNDYKYWKYYLLHDH